MQPLDAVYLQILKNLCTDLSEPVPLDGVDPSALYRLAEKHCSLPFLLPYLNSSRSFCSQTADEADAALLLSAGTFYTPYFFAPPCGEDSLLSLKRASVSPPIIPFPNIGSWEIWIFIFPKKMLFPVPAGFLTLMATRRSRRRAITMSPTASLFPRLAAPLRWNSITASSVFISFPGPMNWWTKFFPPVI